MINFYLFYFVTVVGYIAHLVTPIVMNSIISIMV